MTQTIAPLVDPGSSPKLDPQENHLLAALSPEVQTRLYPHMELVPLELRSLLYESGQPMRHVYFPADAIISIQFMLQNGTSTAISIVGNEGLLGISLFLGFEPTSSRSFVQSAGHAYRLPKELVQKEFDRHSELMWLMLRYTQATISHVTQTAICNRYHSVFEQLCRWLLLTLDRLPHNEVTMTQEFISTMIGVRREGVTAAAMKLKDADIISYHRGLITVLDRPALERAACECYEQVRSETEKILHYVPQRRAVLDNPVPVVKVAKSPAGKAPRGAVSRSNGS